MLIIVESPAKAKTISKIVGNKYKVKASVGHIRRITDDKKTKDGRKLEINGIDIEKGFKPIYEVDQGKKKVVSELKKLAKDAKEILFATDSDREGEAISWHLAELLGIKDKSKVKRLEFHEITKPAIEHAIQDPTELNMELVEAQQARQVLDKLVGYKLSPVLWSVMSNNHLSAGRVQSPALALIYKREKEIQDFVPQEYWEIEGLFDSNKNDGAKIDWISSKANKDLVEDDEEKDEIENLFKLKKAQGKAIPKTISSKNEVEDLIETATNFTEYEVVEIKKKKVTNRTRPPFTTSTLQQAASSKLGFGPKMTMQLAQKLYEGVEGTGISGGLITYMRTDSVNLSKESVSAARKYIKSQYSQYLPEKPKFYKGKTRNAQEAHEAIRPTDPLLSPDKLRNKLDARMWKLYDLIWKQTVACQMTDEIRELTTFDLENTKKDLFTGSVSQIKHLGYKALTGYKKEDLDASKEYKKGDKLNLERLFCEQKFTKPPGRYSAASLIKKLEELGIGRPSTYASIISTLQDRSYVEMLGKAMKPTALGCKVAELLMTNFEEVTDARLTARMEDDLDEISNGKKEYQQVLEAFWGPFKKHVDDKKEEVKAKKDEYRSLESGENTPPCPTCNSEMILKLGRFGEYYQCQGDKSHMFPKNFREYEVALKEAQEKFGDQTKGKKCEDCGKDLIVKVSKKTLNPYISCPEYRVGNKHTVMSVSFGECPKCAKEDRKGVLQQKSYKGRKYLGCSLVKECGYTEKISK